MYRENRKEKAVEVSEDVLLEIFRKGIVGENWSTRDVALLDSIKRKQTVYGLIISKIRKSKELFEKEGKTLDITPKGILELFREMERGRRKPPFVMVIKTIAPEVPAPTTPATPASTVPPATTAEPTTKERVLWEGWEGKKRERQPMRYEVKPEGRHDNILWGTPKSYDFGRGQIEPAVPARSNRRDVWLVFSTPLEDKDFGYPRPVVIPWGKEAEFGNVFRTKLPAFSQETIEEGTVIVRSSVHFAQEVLQRKGPVAVLFKGEEFCLIHVGDERLRRRVEQELNHAQKETTGKNPWIVTRLGLLRSPEYRVPDEKVLEVLQTAVAAAEAREKKVTVEKIETVTKNAETSVSA